MIGEVPKNARRLIIAGLCSLAGSGALYGCASSSQPTNRRSQNSPELNTIKPQIIPESVSCELDPTDPIRPVTRQLANLIGLSPSAISSTDYGGVHCTQGLSINEINIAASAGQAIVADIKGTSYLCGIAGVEENQRNKVQDLEVTQIPPDTNAAFNYFAVLCAANRVANPGLSS